MHHGKDVPTWNRENKQHQKINIQINSGCEIKCILPLLQNICSDSKQALLNAPL